MLLYQENTVYHSIEDSQTSDDTFWKFQDVVQKVAVQFNFDTDIDYVWAL